MKVFDIKDFHNWEKVEAGEVVELPCPNATRKVHIRVNATKPVAVYISDTENMAVKTLAGYSSGMFDVKATISANAFFSFEPEDGAQVYVAQQIGGQVIAPSGLEKYTSLEPRGRRNSELDRMMHFVKLNEKRRDQQLAAERAEMAAAKAAYEAMTKSRQHETMSENRQDETTEEVIDDLQKEEPATAG